MDAHLDYAAERAAFTWDRARADLDGLPGGGLNIAYEAVDRHVVHGNGDVVAFRFLAEDGPDRNITYAELARLTDRFANVLGGLGVEPGALLFALSGRHPDLYVAMLGALKARCGVSPLFSAFGPDPVRQRMRAGRGQVLVTTAAGVAAISGWTHPDPADLLGQARAEALRRLGAQLTLVMTEVAALTRRLTTAGARHGAPLVAIYGIAGLTAAELLGLLGPGQRFASDAQLASYAGVAPLAASSGPHQRHRLNRGGQRQLNAILERIALTQGRGYAPAHAYLARRQHEGKRPREARRALKRYLARAVWQALQQCAPLPLAALADLIPGSSLGLDPPLT